MARVASGAAPADIPVVVAVVVVALADIRFEECFRASAEA